MRGPVLYAQAIVVARAIKSRLLRGDVIREAVLAKDLGEALATLRESLYPGIGEAKTLTQALASLWGGYFKTLDHLARVAPSEAQDIILALGRDEDLRDLITITYRSTVGKPPEEMLPSSFHDKTLTYNVMRNPELLTSPQKILEFTERTWAHPYIEISQRIAREFGGTQILWSIPLLVVRLYMNSMKGLGQAKREGVKKLLSPGIEYKMLSALITAKHLDVPLKLIDIALGEERAKICDIIVEDLRSIYEREADAISLANELRGLLKNVKVEGKIVDKILLNALKSSRQSLRARALSAMSGYPFNPAFLAASIILLKLEVETLTFIVSSKEYKVGPADVVEKLGIESS